MEEGRVSQLEEENRRLREQLAKLGRTFVPPSRGVSEESASSDDEAYHIFPEFEGGKCVAIGLAQKPQKKRRHRSKKSLSENQKAKKKERSNHRRHRRKHSNRPVVLLQSDASVLMPEGEDEFKTRKKEIQQKLTKQFGVLLLQLW